MRVKLSLRWLQKLENGDGTVPSPFMGRVRVGKVFGSMRMSL
jgi:hypothetical protein